MVYCSGFPFAAIFYLLLTAVIKKSFPTWATSGISWLEGPSFQENVLAYGVAVHIDTIDVALRADVLLDDPMAWVVTDTVDTGIVETVTPGPKDIEPIVEPVSFTSTALSVVQTSPNGKTVPKVVQVAPTLGMVNTIQQTPQPSGTSIAFASRQTPFLVARSNPRDRFFDKLVILVFLGLAIAMSVLVLLSLDSGVPPAVLDFLLLLFRSMREEAAVKEVVRIVSLVWKLLFQDEVSEANVPTADQEEHGADSSLAWYRQLTGDMASDNVTYGNDRLQSVIGRSIGSKLYVCWDKEILLAVEDVVLNRGASGSILSTPSTVRLSASRDNLRAFASMAFFSSVNNDGEESAIESVSQAVSRIMLTEDSVNDDQAEVTRMSALSIWPAISDLDVASLACTGTVVWQGTVELEGLQPSLFSSGHSETTRNNLLSLPETYVPVRVDGFYALQQAVDADIAEDGNMSLMHASASYSFSPVLRVAPSGSSFEQAAVDDDAEQQTAVAPASSPPRIPVASWRRKASFVPPLQEGHTPATTRPSPSRNPICPGKPVSRTGAKAPLINPSVRPSPSKHHKNLRSSPPALKAQKQKEKGRSPRRYGHLAEGMVRTSPPRSSNPVLRSTSSGHSLEDGPFQAPACAAALPIRKRAPLPGKGQRRPDALAPTPSRSSQPQHRDHTPCRFPMLASQTRAQEESGSPASRARRCYGLGCSQSNS
ncbi:hypothetical protein ARMSODRAFT_382084 [Armillaria solidipes]|uniref:Transmembrane protein n=1 Tax=Armillaria solidipes TaxID=1076256 RepID=A0A2H3BPZ8_9AGAR|nr:hypothetical protein ARMSODRAFT_382084 [Armillaria solidipes]